jgi:hypothetical protein
MSFPSDSDSSTEVSLCKPASEAKDLGIRRARSRYPPVSNCWSAGISFLLSNESSGPSSVSHQVRRYYYLTLATSYGSLGTISQARTGNHDSSML